MKYFKVINIIIFGVLVSLAVATEIRVTIPTSKQLQLKCEEDTLISIMDPQYNIWTNLFHVNCRNTNGVKVWETIYNILQTCQNKQNCRVDLKNVNIGNCTDYQKYINIKYTCNKTDTTELTDEDSNDDVIKSEVLNKENKIILQCKRNSVIYFLYSGYMWTGLHKPNCPEIDTWHSWTVVYRILSGCLNKQSCIIDMNDIIFVNCPDYYKNLNVNYTCNSTTTSNEITKIELSTTTDSEYDDHYDGVNENIKDEDWEIADTTTLASAPITAHKEEIKEWVTLKEQPNFIFTTLVPAPESKLPSLPVHDGHYNKTKEEIKYPNPTTRPSPILTTLAPAQESKTQLPPLFESFYQQYKNEETKPSSLLPCQHLGKHPLFQYFNNSNITIIINNN